MYVVDCVGIHLTLMRLDDCKQSMLCAVCTLHTHKDLACPFDDCNEMICGREFMKFDIITVLKRTESRVCNKKIIEISTHKKQMMSEICFFCERLLSYSPFSPVLCSTHISTKEHLNWNKDDSLCLLCMMLECGKHIRNIRNAELKCSFHIKPKSRTKERTRRETQKKARPRTKHMNNNDSYNYCMEY